MERIEYVIREHIYGIISIDFADDCKRAIVYTKNTFTDFIQLSALMSALDAKNIEVGNGYVQPTLMYTIYL